MSEQVKYQGALIKIGSREYMMPSLSVKQAKKLWPQILEIDNTSGDLAEIKQRMPQKFDDMLAIIHAALSRNYPDVTLAQLEEDVSIHQVKELILIVSGQSGFEAKGETKPEVAQQPTVH